MRFVASAPESGVRAALRALLAPGSDLDMNEDELRLYAAGVLTRVLVQVRGRAREKWSEDVSAVPV